MKSETDKLIATLPYHQRELLYGIMGKIISLGIMVEQLYAKEFSGKEDPQKAFKEFSEDLLGRLHLQDSNQQERSIRESIELQIDAISYRLAEDSKEESPR